MSNGAGIQHIFGRVYCRSGSDALKRRAECVQRICESGGPAVNGILAVYHGPVDNGRLAGTVHDLKFRVFGAVGRLSLHSYARAKAGHRARRDYQAWGMCRAAQGKK